MERILAIFQWKKERETVWDLQGEGEETIYLGPWGYICFPEKIPESNQVTSPGEAPAQGQVEGSLGQCQPRVLKGVKRKAGGQV